MLIQIGVSINDKDLTLRLLMGSMLSFLYMPEKDEENIKNYVKLVIVNWIYTIQSSWMFWAFILSNTNGVIL